MIHKNLTYCANLPKILCFSNLFIPTCQFLYTAVTFCNSDEGDDNTLAREFRRLKGVLLPMHLHFPTNYEDLQSWIIICSLFALSGESEFQNVKKQCHSNGMGTVDDPYLEVYCKFGNRVEHICNSLQMAPSNGKFSFFLILWKSQSA